MKQIGKIIHYYGKIGVAIVELSDTLQKGEMIRIEKGDYGFDMEVGSMEYDHKPIEKAKKGETVGIKMPEIAPDGAKVYRL